MINVVLTLEELKQAKACDAGLEFFEENFGEILIVANWTSFHSLYCSTSMDADFFEWAVSQGLLPETRVIDQKIEGFDLRDATLRYSYFNYANFKDCSFHDAALEYSALHDSIFSTCDFSGSMICKTVSDGCIFTDCNFRGADLGVADLRDSIFRNCDFKGANFYHANLNGVYFDEDCILVEAGFRGADLRFIAEAEKFTRNHKPFILSSTNTAFPVER